MPFIPQVLRVKGMTQRIQEKVRGLAYVDSPTELDQLLEEVADTLREIEVWMELIERKINEVEIQANRRRMF